MGNLFVNFPNKKQEEEENTEKEEKLLFECKSKFVNILEEARNLLQLEYYSSTELNPAKFDAEEKFKYLFLFNDKEEFQFPGKLHITNVSGSFVSFIFNYLSDFFYKNNENGLQDVDVQSVGLLFDLWMSVIPLFHAQMIQVPRIAALFYCDTILLAHFITVLPLLFPFHRLFQIFIFTIFCAFSEIEKGWKCLRYSWSISCLLKSSELPNSIFMWFVFSSLSIF